MIILDTNVISEIFRPLPEPRVVDWLTSLEGDIAITSVTRAELLAGVRRLPDGRHRDDLTGRIDAALSPYWGGRAVVPFDDVAVDRYADVFAARESAGAPISTVDAQIAAICLAHGATCAARNVKDFQQTGVELVDPWTVDGLSIIRSRSSPTRNSPRPIWVGFGSSSTASNSRISESGIRNSPTVTRHMMSTSWLGSKVAASPAEEGPAASVFRSYSRQNTGVGRTKRATRGAFLRRAGSRSGSGVRTRARSAPRRPCGGASS